MTVPDNGAKAAGPRPDPRTQAAALAATLELLHEIGLEQLTMGIVARHAGVSKATLQRWWPSKIALAIDAIGSDLGPPLQITGGTATDIRALVEWTINTGAQRIGEVFVSDLSRDPTTAFQLENLLGPHRAAHSALLAAAAGRGDLPYDLDLPTILDVLTGTALFRKLMRRPLNNTLIDQLTALLQHAQLPRTNPTAAR